MPQYVQLPNGQYFPLKEGESPYAAIAEAQQLYPDIFGLTKKEEPKEQPQSGFVPAFKSSASQLKEDMARLGAKTGIISPERAEQIAQEEEAYQKKTFKPTEKSFLEDPLTKLKELAGGSAPYMLAPAALGATALALPEAAAAAPVIAGGSAVLDALGLGTVGEAAAASGAGLASLAQFTGSNISRQMDTGKSLADTSLGSAALAAIPQAALDVFGLKMIPGIRNIFAEAGRKISDAEARAIASQGLAKTLGDYAVTTGKVAGAEGLTEAGQQVFERLQAGLSLTDPDAQKEYFDNFLGGAVLGGVLGVPGRFVERGQAKSQAVAADRADQAKQLAQQQALDAQQQQEQEAYKQTPEYIQDLTQRWNTFDKQYQDLRQKAKGKAPEGDLIAAANKKDARVALKELMTNPDTQDLIKEYQAVQAKVDAQRAEDERQKLAAEKKAAYDLSMQKYGAQGELFAGTPDQELIEANRAEQPKQETQVPTAKEFNNLHTNIARGLYLARQNAAEAEDEDVAAQHINEHAALTEQQKKLEKLRPLVEKAEPNERLVNPADLNFEDTDSELRKQRKKLDDARQLGDMAAAKKASDKIQELKQRPTLFGEDNTRAKLEAAQDAERIKFTEEIEAKRQESIAQRQKLEDEVTRLQKIADANKEKGIFEGSVAQKQLEDAKALLATFKQKPYKTQTGHIMMAPQREQDYNALKKEPTYAQQDIEGEPSNLELLDQRISDLTDALLPGALKANAQPATVVSAEKQTQERAKTLEKIRDFNYRINDLKKRLPAMHAEIVRGIEHPEYSDLIKEYKYLTGRLEELQGVSERVKGPGRYLPIVEAQNILDNIDTNRKLLVDLNAAVQKAGRPTEPAKVEALNNLRQRRAYIQEQLEADTKKYNANAQREQRTQPKAEQEQGDLFGLAGTYAKSAGEVQKIKDRLDDLYQERDNLKASFQRRSKEANTPLLKQLIDKFSKEPTQRFEQLNKEIERTEQEHLNATGKVSDKFQAFADEREAQKTPVEQPAEQKLLPGFGLKQYNEIKKPVTDADLMAAKTKQVNLQTQLEKVRAAVGKTSKEENDLFVELARLRKSKVRDTKVLKGDITGLSAIRNATYAKQAEEKLEQRIKDAQKTREENLIKQEEKIQEQIEKAKAKVADLERKQRAYEDQQDAINKAPPGQREAQRIIAGEGYRDYKGVVRTSPKNKASWGIENLERAKIEKPTALAKAVAKTQTAEKLAETAAREKESVARNPTVEQARNNLNRLENNVVTLAAELQPSGIAEVKAAQERLEVAQADASVAAILNRDPENIKNLQEELKAAEKELADLTAKPVLGPIDELAKYKHAVSLQTQKIRNIRKELPEEAALSKLLKAQEEYDAIARRQAVQTTDKNLDTLKEIDSLQAFLERYGPRETLNNVDTILENLEKGIDASKVAQLATQMQANMRNMENQVTPIAKKLEEFKEQYDEIIKSGYSPIVQADYIEELIKKAASADKAHTAAVVRYATARRDLLAFQYGISKRLQKAYEEAVAARDAELTRQENDPELKQIADNFKQANKTQARTDAILKAAIEKQKLEEAKARATQKNKEAKQEQAIKNAKAVSGGIPKDVLQRAREGLGLEGVRVEKDTSGALANAVQNNAKKMLGRAETMLEDAINRDDVEAVKKHTLEVKRYERELQQIMPVAETKKTELGVEKVAENQPEAIPGERLRARREGPVVSKAARAPSTMMSGTAESRVSQGRRNPPKQAGVVRLKASDLNHDTANAISLATIKKKLDASTGEEKAKYQEAFDGATKNMTPKQVEERLKEGDRLLASGPTMAIIAAKERFRAATEAYKKAIERLNEAEDKATADFPNSAGIKLAQDDFDAADEAKERAEAAMHKAVEDHKKSKEKTTSVREADSAVEDDIEFTDKAGRFDRLKRAIDEDDTDFFASSVKESGGTPLPDKALGHLLDGSLIKSLEDIAKNDKTFLGQHADAIRPLLMRTKVEIVPELIHKGKRVPALYQASTNTVFFTPEGFTIEDVVHEATHAATMRALTMPESDLTPTQRKARRELQAMFNKLSKDPNFEGQYGLENLKEFASEVLSDQAIRNRMDKLPWFRGNMLERFFRAVMELLHIRPMSENMLARAEELTKALFMQSRSIENAEDVGAAPKYKSALVGSTPGKWENFRGNFFGLSGRVQIVDKLAAADAAIVAGEGNDKLTSTEAFNTQYFMRMGDQVSTAAGQFILHGPMKIVSEDTPLGKEYRYESQKGTTLVDVSDHLGNMAKELGVDVSEAERMATVLIAGERAKSISNGWERLNSDNPAGVKAEYDADTAAIKSNPKAKAFFEAVRKSYKEYNDGQLDFAVQSDFMSKEEAERLKRLPYIPYYRIKDGAVQLFTADERPITIGNIKDNPDLQQMVGDNKHILPLLTSAVQNTFMLTRMSLHNKATLETANGLFKAGFVSKMGAGVGLANVNTVHYKIKGKDAFATIDADTFGIPAHLIVKGMEGIKTTIPALVKAMGIPSQWIRKFVTRIPAYGVRQLVRDPVNSFILSGTDGIPIVNALKELSKMQFGKSQAEEDLMRGLAVSSNIFSGDEKDMTKFLSDIATGKSPWQTFLGKLDRFALQADTATRAVIYEDGLKKGLSKARAQFRAFESQNLSRRGLSPSMQMLNTLIPFFNSQVQGLDVLYRSLTNQMPFAEQMEVRRKLVARSMLLMGVSLGYALMMQDDDDYRKARPEERYGNFFVHLPFVKDPLKIPIPYEIGILFKAVPEAIIDSMHNEMTTYEAARGMGKLIWQNAVPNLIPAAVKPVLEASYGETAFGPIESEREKKLVATERYRPETTELAKFAGKATGLLGVSPIMLEHFVRGYTGSLGLAAMHMVDPVFASGQEGEKPSLPASKMPFIGSLFQTSEGHYLIERAYERMKDAEQAQATYKDMLKKGQRANAEAFRQSYANLVAAGSAAREFQKNMGTMFSMARAIQSNPTLTREEKEKRLEELSKRENAFARRFTEMADRRVPR